MTFAEIGPAEILTLGIILGAVGSGICVGLVFKAITGPGRRGRVKRLAEASLDEFASRISRVEHKQRVLSVYVSDYFNTFHEAGWEELQSLLDNLRITETSLRVMFDQGQYGEVLDVCDYLLGCASEESAREVTEAYEGLSSIANWREDSRVILLRLIKATTASAEKTVELGVHRNKMNRRPTLLSLSELRDSMGDF